MCITCIEDALREGSHACACAALDASLAVVPHISNDERLLELCGQVLVTGVASCARHVSYQPFADNMAALVLTLLSHVAHDEQLSSDLLGALLAACSGLIGLEDPAGPLACLSLLGDCMTLSAVFTSFAVTGASSVVPLICSCLRRTDDDVAEAGLFLMLQLLVHASSGPVPIETFLSAFAEADGLPAVVALLAVARDCSDGVTNNGLAFLKVLCAVQTAAPLVQHFAGEICVAVMPKLVSNHRSDFVVAAADILSAIASFVSLAPTAADITVESLRTASDSTAPALAKLLLALSPELEPTRALLMMVLRLCDVSDRAFELVVMSSDSPLLSALVRANKSDSTSINSVAAAAVRSAHCLPVFLQLLVTLALHVDSPPLLSHDQAVLAAHVLLNTQNHDFFARNCVEALSIAAFLSVRTDSVHEFAAEALLRVVAQGPVNPAAHGTILAAVERLGADILRPHTTVVLRYLLRSPSAVSHQAATFAAVAPMVDWPQTRLSSLPPQWLPQGASLLSDEPSFWAEVVLMSDAGARLVPRLLCSQAARGARPPVDGPSVGAVLAAFHSLASVRLSVLLELLTAAAVWWRTDVPAVLCLSPVLEDRKKDIAAYVETWLCIGSAAVEEAVAALLEHCSETEGLCAVACDLAVQLVLCSPAISSSLMCALRTSAATGAIVSEAVRCVRRRHPDQNLRVWAFIQAALRSPEMEAAAVERTIDTLLAFCLTRSAEMPAEAVHHLETVQMALAADVECRASSGDVAFARWACPHLATSAAAWKILHLLLQRHHSTEIRRKVRDAVSRALPDTAPCVQELYAWVVRRLVLPASQLPNAALRSLLQRALSSGDSALVALCCALMASEFDTSVAPALAADSTNDTAHWLFDHLCDIVVSSPLAAATSAAAFAACIARRLPETVDSVAMLGAVLFALAPAGPHRLPQHVVARLVVTAIDPQGKRQQFCAPAWWSQIRSVDDALQRFLDSVAAPPVPAVPDGSEALIALADVVATASHRPFSAARIADFVSAPAAAAPLPTMIGEVVDGAMCYVHLPAILTSNNTLEK
jgi:hypothetical protein